MYRATEHFVRFAGFESAAASVAQSRRTVASLRKAAAEFAERLNAASLDDAGHYAIRLITRFGFCPATRSRCAAHAGLRGLPSTSARQHVLCGAAKPQRQNAHAPL